MKKRMTPKRNLNKEGELRYKLWSDKFETDPRLKRIYAEESVKMELWLQLAEARQAVGLTQTEMAKRLGVSQAQVARIEKRGYDAYTLNTLRRYVQALGKGFALEVTVRQLGRAKAFGPSVPSASV